MILLFRKLHLYLGLVSSLFLVLVCVTGVILSIKPIQNQVNSNNISNFDEESLAGLIESTLKVYPEILELYRTDDNTIRISAFNEEYDLIEGTISPVTYKVVPEVSTSFFSTVKTLHRSLFFGTVGRITIALISLLLLLITISGIIIFIKRQLGVKKYFSKIKSDKKFHRWHMRIGRYAFPILLITSLTAIILSLQHFGIVKSDNEIFTVEHTLAAKEQQPISEFKIYRNTAISDFIKLEFPFSPEPEDYFTLETDKGRSLINQFDGEIIKLKEKSFTNKLLTLSFNLHTGNGSIIWSIILGIGSLSIIYFVYSGLRIWLNRKSTKYQNLVQNHEAEIVILYGSENNSTYDIAKHFYEELGKHCPKVLLTSLNNWTNWQNCQHIFILTSTYGKGEAPTNANQFLEKLDQVKQSNRPSISILGFGSTDYPSFCEFAKQIYHQITPNYTTLVPFTTINNQSEIELNNWFSLVSNRLGFNIPSPEKKFKEIQFSIIEKKYCEESTTILLKLKVKKKVLFESGDLLGIKMTDDSKIRHYSIAKLDKKTLLISVKIHKLGLCSSFLDSLAVKDQFKGRIIASKFKMKESEGDFMYVSNGTGIAPFIGFTRELKNSTGEIKLFWGGKSKSSFEIYRSELLKNVVNHYYFTYSKEDNQYIQEQFSANLESIVNSLENNGRIMICGSILMRNDIYEILSTALAQVGSQQLEDYIAKGQILSDCY